MGFSLRGKHGEWYVVAQVALILLVLLGPQNLGALPAWPAFIRPVTTVLGILLFLVGAGMLIAAGFKLGATNLPPLPYPRERGRLVQTGAYCIVRHPMYCGG